MFIQIGRMLIAVEHITSVYLSEDGEVQIYTQGDTQPWKFRGHEAELLKAWLASRTKDLATPPTATEKALREKFEEFFASQRDTKS